MIKKYYWSELPDEIKDEFWNFMKGTSEEKDDYINRNDVAQLLGEWEELIVDYNAHYKHYNEGRKSERR